MKESPRRTELIKLLSPLHAVAVENSIGEGTPDVNCSAGWIEVKQLDEWPSRADTVVRPRHFTDDQRHWLQKRCQQGGRAWLLLCVGSEWCLVWGAAAATSLGVYWTRSDLVTPANDRLHWHSAPSSSEMVRVVLLRHWA